MDAFYVQFISIEWDQEPIYKIQEKVSKKPQTLAKLQKSRKNTFSIFAKKYRLTVKIEQKEKSVFTKAKLLKRRFFLNKNKLIITITKENSSKDKEFKRSEKTRVVTLTFKICEKELHGQLESNKLNIWQIEQCPCEWKPR